MLEFTFDDDGLAMIEALVDTFDFTLPGRAGASLGEDVAAMAADTIAQRSNQGLDINGAPFTPNEAKYAARKLRRYSVDRPGELSGQMLSLQACLGKPTVTPDELTLTHGNNVTPESQGYTRSRTGVAMKPHELQATDRDKGIWFTAGGREFYAIDAAGEELIAKRVDESLDDHVKAAQ